MLMFHVVIAAVDGASIGPSEIASNCQHAYSVPDRSTPCGNTTAPASSTSLSPTIVSPPFDAAPSSVTVAVAPELAVADPDESVAVTSTRSVCPTSLLVGTYTLEVPVPDST